MNRAGRIIAVCGLSMALMMPQIVYAAETLSVQVSERTGLTTVGNKQSAYDNVAISHVSNYVNIRSEANTSSSIVGKIYNNCAATILATVDGEGGTWYQIKSGTVTGYIKSEYFITGADAERIAKDIGTVYVTVSADSLRLREQPSTDSAILTTLSKDAEYLEVKEEGDFIEIQVDESLSGYVHKDYVTQRVEFKQAVSVEEEKQKAEEAARIARLSRAMGCGDFVKVEIMRDAKYLFPDNYETVKATEILAKEGFVVLPYMNPDLNVARDLQNAGAAAVMPLAAPIGSNKGLATKAMIQVLIDEIDLPIIVDAGIGKPSQACEAMEMGAAAIMANTAIATAGDVPEMAAAFKLAIEAGRKACLTGMGRVLARGGSASDPLTGFLR